MKIMKPLRIFGAYLAICIGICSAGYLLNQTCSLPASQGGKGYCGPSFCDSIVNPDPGCIFTNKVINYPLLVSKTLSKVCTQSTDPRCTSAALAAVMVGQGIKAAFCNDQFLVILTDGSGGFQTLLGSIKNPPASSDSTGTTCVTRFVNPIYMTVKIPLFPTLLSTSDPAINNVNTNSFPNGPGDNDAAYMSLSTPGTAATYGLPTRGNIF